MASSRQEQECAWAADRTFRQTTIPVHIAESQLDSSNRIDYSANINIFGVSNMGRLRDYFKENPFLLAHHPSCESFSNHTLNIRGWRLCLGCFVIYPSAIVSLLVLFVLLNYFAFDYMAMFIGSVIFFGINLIRKIVFKDNLQKRTQVVFRMILGLSLAFILTAIWLAPPTQRLYIILLFLSIAIGYNLFNSKKMLKTCKECSRYPEFPKCEGLNDVK